MRRREFITLLGSATASWPLAAHAKQHAMPVIGYVSARSPEAEKPILVPFMQTLEKSGFVVGRNVAIEFRFAKGRLGRLPALVTELIRQPVSVIMATARPSASAAKAATSTIPIVFTSGGDPVKLGLVTSFSRPAGNATGVYALTLKLGPKRLELLREILPGPGPIAFVVNPAGALTPVQVEEVQAAARAIGQPLLVIYAGTAKEVDAAFATMAKENVAGILYGASLFFQVIRDQLISLAAHYRIPALYEWPEFVIAGGLMSYSTDRSEVARQAGAYVGRILRGEEPADLPVVQSRKFKLAINLKTAKMLGLTVPPTLLAQANEVVR